MNESVTTWYLEICDRTAISAPKRPPSTPFVIEGQTGRESHWRTSRRMYREVGRDWRWTDRLDWSAEQWAEWSTQAETWVVKVDERVAGYVELHHADQAIEIAYFGLLPTFHGLGIGGHLLTFALSRGLEVAPRVWLHTCSLDGPHALRNYLARGLRIFRVEVATA